MIECGFDLKALYVGVLDVEVPSQLGLRFDGPLLPLLMLRLLIVHTQIEVHSHSHIEHLSDRETEYLQEVTTQCLGQ